jgi:hypothetical protein
MRLVIKKLLTVSTALFLLIACGNNNKANPKIASVNNYNKPFNPSELLKYDPKSADKRIDEFFHKLHQKH